MRTNLLTWSTVVVIYFMCLICEQLVEAIGPITVGVVAAIGGGAFYFIKCKFAECCHEPWVRSSPEILRELEKNISGLLHGQPFVNQLVYPAIKSHVTDPNPSKPLVMSFHGGSGTGKNYVTEIIAQALFQTGLKSEYFVKYVAADNFPEKDPISIRSYREELKKKVVNTLSFCKKSLFVIDEVHRSPPGILDILTPFLDHGQGKVQGVEKHHSIFIFLSNTGSHQITARMFQHWKEGKSRSDLILKDMEKMINIESFNEEGQGFYGSDIMARSLIDHYIAFLPLEKKHIRMCIQDHMLLKYGKTRDTKFIDEVIDELEYWPPDSQLYSRTGCKRVQKKVDVKWGD